MSQYELPNTDTFAVNIDDKCFTTLSKFTNGEGEVVYRLYWNDGVVNEWTEYYSTLAIALARLAVLAECVAEDKGFVTDATEFEYFGKRFINNQAGA